MVNILDFMSHPVSVATTEFCSYSKKVGIENTVTNGCGCIPINYFQKQLGRGQLSHSLQTLNHSHQLTSHKKE